MCVMDSRTTGRMFVKPQLRPAEGDAIPNLIGRERRGA